jgi:hypothetical protein
LRDAIFPEEVGDRFDALALLEAGAAQFAPKPRIKFLQY